MNSLLIILGAIYTRVADIYVSEAWNLCTGLICIRIKCFNNEMERSLRLLHLINDRFYLLYIHNSRWNVGNLICCRFLSISNSTRDIDSLVAHSQWLHEYHELIIYNLHCVGWSWYCGYKYILGTFQFIGAPQCTWTYLMYCQESNEFKDNAKQISWYLKSIH